MRAADRVPYRLLDEAPEEGFGEGEPTGLLVQGDNLDALKALLPFYAGRVRCIYIDIKRHQELARGRRQDLAHPVTRFRLRFRAPGRPSAEGRPGASRAAGSCRPGW